MSSCAAVDFLLLLSQGICADRLIQRGWRLVRELGYPIEAAPLLPPLLGIIVARQCRSRLKPAGRSCGSPWHGSCVEADPCEVVPPLGMQGVVRKLLASGGLLGPATAFGVLVRQPLSPPQP
eukprot:COSAG01_NODE_24285_length_783_cov_1.004380_1_plen_122_part_00